MKKNYLVTLLALLGIIFFIAFICISKKEIYFNIVGSKKIELNIKEKYNEQGFEAKYCSKYFKFFCINLNKYVSVDNTLNTNIIGNYVINYNLKINDINKIISRSVEVKDKVSPIIKLSDSKESICPKADYKEDGFTAFDNIDGDITDKVITTIKDGKIYYSVKDSSGNKRILFRKINYKDNNSPKIELFGGNTKYVFLNTKYNEDGFTANDDCDGDLSNKVVIKSDVDTSKEGTYKIDYSVSDNNGNETIVSKKVIVYKDTSVIPKNGKIVYLTFDDGPCSYTQSILDILNKYNVKATFFVTHQFADYQYMIKKEYDSGHSIGIHTYSHNYKDIYASEDNYLNDFNTMNQTIFNETGIYSKLLRFPGGGSNTISRFNKGIMTKLSQKFTEMGYYYFDWNIDSGDTSSKDPEVIYNNVINEIQNREHSVVLMHDIKKANIESVEKIINYGLDNGYTFMSLDETSPTVHHHVNN